MIEVNWDNITEQLRTLAAERPEYVYERSGLNEFDEGTCLYVHGDEPGCIFGHALNRLGVSLDTLTEYEGEPISGLLRDLSSDGWIAKSLDDEQVRRLDNVQGAQDDGRAWADAVSELDYS